MGWCAPASDGECDSASWRADICRAAARIRAPGERGRAPGNAATPAVVVPAAAPAPALPAAPACSIALVKRQSKCCQCHEHGSDAQRGDPAVVFGCHSPTSSTLPSAAPALPLRERRRRPLRRLARDEQLRAPFRRAAAAIAAAAAAVVEPVAHRELRQLAPPADDARRIVGGARRRVPPTPAVATRDGLVPEYALSRWLSFCPAANPKNPGKGTKFHPSVAWVGEGGRCLKYHTVYKGANDAIRLTLLEAGSRGGGLKWFGRLPPRVSEPQRCTSTLSFTFVREPLGHFVSGFAEMCYRASPTVPIGRAFARAFVQALLDGHAGFACRWRARPRAPAPTARTASCVTTLRTR